MVDHNIWPEARTPGTFLNRNKFSKRFTNSQNHGISAESDELHVKFFYFLFETFILGGYEIPCFHQITNLNRLIRLSSGAKRPSGKTTVFNPGKLAHSGRAPAFYRNMSPNRSRNAPEFSAPALAPKTSLNPTPIAGSLAIWFAAVLFLFDKRETL
jgi:hypothetical protein